MFQQEGKHYGKILWLKEPLAKTGKEETDVNSPDLQLLTQPIVAW
jgi:hypothetical protein